MWNLKYAPNELAYETGRLTDTENKLVVSNGERRGKGQFRGVGVGSKNYWVCKIYNTGNIANIL